MAKNETTVERVVKAQFVRYTKLVPVPGSDDSRPVIATARRNESVNVLESEVERLEALDSFLSDATVTRTEDGEVVEVDVREMTDGDLAAWIKDEGPTAKEVVDLAGDDAEIAQRLLNAEQTATEGHPRKNVSGPLTKIIDDAQAGDSGVETEGTP